MGITTIGTQKYRLKGLNKQEDGLNIGTIERIDREGDYKPTKEFTHLVELLQAILDDVNIYGDDEKNFEETAELCMNAVSQKKLWIRHEIRE